MDNQLGRSLMQLNGSPLNSLQLNDIGSGETEPALPIASARAFRWALLLIVDGVDMSARLTGQVSVDREEGAAGTASFTLHLPSGAVNPDAWRGKIVSIDYISTNAGETSQVRRFTGRIADPTYSLTQRLLDCQCTDQLQQRVEALSVAEVDSLAGGYWSDDVYEPVLGRSRWDYMQERLASRPVSLECSSYGDLRVTSWFKSAPAFEFGPGTTVFDSLSVDLADLSSLVNKVEVEGEYRFPRLRQQNDAMSWIIPGAVSGGFCGWRIDSTELPDIDMITSATEGAGYVLLNPTWGRLPPDDPDPCATGVAWNNEFLDLLLSANWTAARRWTQSVTEKYTLTVVAEQSVIASGEQIARDRISVETESELADAWESDEYNDGGNGHTDIRDEPRRQSAFACVLHLAQTQIYEAHRATKISWSDPTSMVMGVDLVHTLMLDDQKTKALGKCVRLVDSFDLEGGVALTTISIAVMRGGGSITDPLTVPPFSVEPQPDPYPPSPYPGGLPNQIGGRSDVPPYEEELDGFSGNFSVSDILDPEIYPRRFSLTAPEIEAERRDELEVPLAATYRVAIPNDLLELN